MKRWWWDARTRWYKIAQPLARPLLRLSGLGWALNWHYLPLNCPSCTRRRVEYKPGHEGGIRCEKCGWPWEDS